MATTCGSATTPGADGGSTAFLSEAPQCGLCRMVGDCLAQPGCGGVEVATGGVERCVPQELLQLDDVDAVVQSARGERVTQRVHERPGGYLVADAGPAV